MRCGDVVDTRDTGGPAHLSHLGLRIRYRRGACVAWTAEPQILKAPMTDTSSTARPQRTRPKVSTETNTTVESAHRATRRAAALPRQPRPVSDYPEPLMTVRDVATYLNVSVRTVEALIAEGELVPLRIRSVRRFTREAVQAYVRNATRR